MIVGLFREFPKAGFGMLLGAILGFLVGSVPILGIVFGPLITPLSVAFGLVSGAVQDIGDKALASRIADVNRSFMAMSGS